MRKAGIKLSEEEKQKKAQEKVAREQEKKLEKAFRRIDEQFKIARESGDWSHASNFRKIVQQEIDKINGSYLLEDVIKEKYTTSLRELESELDKMEETAESILNKVERLINFFENEEYYEVDVRASEIKCSLDDAIKKGCNIERHKALLQQYELVLNKRKKEANDALSKALYKHKKMADEMTTEGGVSLPTLDKAREVNALFEEAKRLGANEKECDDRIAFCNSLLNKANKRSQRG